MKRSELKVGDEIYYCPSQDWRVDNSRAEKVVVVDTAGYRTLDRWHRKRVQNGETWEQARSGPLVLVDRHSRYDDDAVTRTVLPLAHLRGPWVELSEQAAKAQAARRERRQAAEDAARNLAEKREAVLERAREAGVKARAAYDGTGDVAVSVEELERLLNLMQAGGVR